MKNYSQFPVSLIDGVSLANKGGGFEVLGNEAILPLGEGKTSGRIFISTKVSQKLLWYFGLYLFL